jgi:PKD repeat protein
MSLFSTLKVTVSAAIVLFSTVSRAQDSVSVLFIGNSYTYSNDLPTLLRDLSASLGDEVTFDSHTPGGTTFANHAANPVVYGKINAQPWDFVVLQAQSQEPSFPDDQVNTNTLPFAMQLADSIYANNFCSEALFFMTWGRENGDPQWAPISTFDGMNGRLRSAYMRFADSTDGAVAPVGSAWKHIRDTDPTINLYVGDGSHPSYAGSYLAACTFYASVFRKSPVGAPFIGSLDPITAGKLQEAAALTVLDSLEHWNLRPISEHTQANFTVSNLDPIVDLTNLSTKAQSYVWDFADGNVSSIESPSHTYVVDGTYPIMLIASSDCDADTMIVEVPITYFAGISELTGVVQLSTKGEGLYEISMSQTIERVVVLDAQGKQIHPHVNLSGTTATIELEPFSVGVYFLAIETALGDMTIKILR